MKVLSTTKTNILLISAVAFLALESCSSLLNRLFDSISSYAFLLLTYGLFAYIIYKSINILISDIKHKQITLVIGFICLLLIYVSFIFIGSFNEDSKTFISNATTAYFNDNALGYNTYINHYSIRPIVILLPIINVFGRTTTALYICFSFVFTIGLIRLYIGFRNYLKFKHIDEKYSLIYMFFVLLIPYIFNIYKSFDISIFSISALFIIAGIVLDYMSNPTNLSIYIEFVFAIIFVNHVTIVDNATILLLLLVFTYILIAFKSNYKIPEFNNKLSYNEKSNVFNLSLLVLVFTIVTYVITYVQIRDNNTVDIYEGIWYKFKEFITNLDYLHYLVVAALILIYLFISITFKFSFLNAIIVVWFLTIIHMSKFISENNYNTIISLLFIVVSIPLCIKVFYVMNKKRLNNIALIIISVICFGCFGFEHYTSIELVEAKNNESNVIYNCTIDFVDNILKSINVDNKDKFVIYYNDLDVINTRDYMPIKYFYPNSIIKNIDDETDTEDLPKILVYLDNRDNIEIRDYELYLIDEGYTNIYKETRTYNNEFSPKLIVSVYN